MNEYGTIKDIMFKIIGEYQPTTPQAVQINYSGIDGVTTNFSNFTLQNGVGNLDICWIASAILLIIAFICTMNIIKSILSSIVR